MGILPIDKTSGYLEMKEKRGLFMTNIISKCVERILFKRRERALIMKLSALQNGGVSKRSIQDDLFIVNHTIYKYRKEKKNLYLLFSDIEKCFDNLWLKDCIIELVRHGTPIQEAMFIYEMNKNVKAIVKTPVGDTDEIELEEIVRQGTVGGNKLCIVSTDRINKMGYYRERDGIRYPLFVDDKIGLGEVETVEEMNHKMKTLETTKKYRYNTKKGKTEWMMNKNCKKKKEEIPELEVNNGKIGRTKQYKYLGDMYDEQGTNESKINHREDQVDMMISNINRESSEKKIGKAALPVRIMLIEAITPPTILANTETWHEITIKEQQHITKIHQKILTRSLHLPKTTPYMGMIAELNVMPFIQTVWFKKFMWYHRLVNSDESRMARIKLMEQVREQDGWFKELQQYADQNNIPMGIGQIKKLSYQQYKGMVKKEISAKVKRDLEQAKANMKKLRWINPGKRQKYLDICSVREASKIMKVRLHMVNAMGNYGGGKCRRCHMEEETTEHILECYTNGKTTFEEEKIENVQWLRSILKTYEEFEEQYNKDKK